MEVNTQDNNKRIAKNTIYLFLRMIVMACIGLFTSRIVLQTLGVADYGVYSVMGGIIGMLGYVNSLLAGGISRFLAVGLGENNPPKLKNLFGTTLSVSMASASIVFILGETIGLWFLNNRMNIDPMRMDAANWVYQCALVSSCLTIMQAPFSASVISHEKMNVFAYMSLLDAVMKLLIVYLLLVGDFDKLIFYAILMLATNLIDIIVYRIYCICKFEECRTWMKMNWSVFREMLSYNGWNMIGGFAGVLSTQGVNVIVNIFFGTTVNAARGVANQISGIVMQLTSNFTTAVTPQIMKYYAQGKLEELHQLVINASRYCTYILLCIIIPLSVNVEGLLSLWLVKVPPHADVFACCVMGYMMLCSFDSPVGRTIHAVGRMKLPNLTTAIVNMMVFPATYLAFKLGGHPAWGYFCNMISVAICTSIDLWMVKRFVGFPVKRMIRKSVIPVIAMFMACLLPAMALRYYIGNDDFWHTMACCIATTLTTCLIIFFIGLPRNMRQVVVEKVKSKF